VPAERWADVGERMAIGFIPWWGIAGVLSTFVFGLTAIAFSGGGPSRQGWGDIDGFEEIDL